MCQRTNVWYDSELRRRYSTILLGGAIVLVGLLFLAGFLAKLPLNEFVVTVLTPAAPVLLWAFRDFFRQRETAEAQEVVKGEAEALWEKVAGGTCVVDECDALSREYQGAIFTRRTTSPLIFPFVYKILRSKMEERMNIGAEELLKRVIK